jgi:hypothetical protein
MCGTDAIRVGVRDSCGGIHLEFDPRAEMFDPIKAEQHPPVLRAYVVGTRGKGQGNRVFT